MEMSFSQLQDELAKKNQEALERGILSSSQRQIRFIEDSLIQEGVIQDLSKGLGELDSEFLTRPLGPNGYTRETYSLSWKIVDDGPRRLVVTNLKAGKDKLLFDCPVEIQKVCLELMPNFVEFIGNYKKE